MPDHPNLETPIAIGRTAEIFPWGDGHVIKLTRAEFPAYLADQEWKNAQIVWQLGARAPRPVEILDVDGRRGVVFDRIDGPTMSNCVQRSPLQIGAYARWLGRLHAELHTLSVPMLPSQHDRIARKLERSTLLPEKLEVLVRRLLADLPDSDGMCHGDFHPENIIFSPSGPVIIDWEGCMHGNPSADVATTCLWIRSAMTFGQGIRGWVRRQAGRWFERVYLAEYERMAPGQIEDLERWIAVLAACRMHEEKSHEAPYLLPMIEQAG